MNLTVFNHGKTAIDLDEVRMINGSAIIFKNDLKVYDIGEEAADAVHQMLNSSSPPPLLSTSPRPPCKTTRTACKTLRTRKTGNEPSQP